MIHRRSQDNSGREIGYALNWVHPVKDKLLPVSMQHPSVFFHPTLLAGPVSNDHSLWSSFFKISSITNVFYKYLKIFETFNFKAVTFYVWISIIVFNSHLNPVLR